MVPIEYNQRIHQQFHEPFGLDLKLNGFEKFDFEIIFHPKSQDWIKKDIKKMLETFDIELKSND